jgi:hypothetical protein
LKSLKAAQPVFRLFAPFPRVLPRFSSFSPSLFPPLTGPKQLPFPSESLESFLLFNFFQLFTFPSILLVFSVASSSPVRPLQTAEPLWSSLSLEAVQPFFDFLPLSLEFYLDFLLFSVRFPSLTGPLATAVPL